jgi:hypothetical protein
VEFSHPENHWTSLLVTSTNFDESQKRSSVRRAGTYGATRVQGKVAHARSTPSPMDIWTGSWLWSRIWSLGLAFNIYIGRYALLLTPTGHRCPACLLLLPFPFSAPNPWLCGGRPRGNCWSTGRSAQGPRTYVMIPINPFLYRLRWLFQFRRAISLAILLLRLDV